MDGFLRVDNPNLPDSPTNSFMADEVASICPLITPSPPTNALVNPLPEPEPDYTSIGLELANKLNHVKADGTSDEEKAESASSSSSALAEPACAQLLNHRNVYQHIVTDEEKTVEEDLGTNQALQLTFRNPPDNYFFMSWNWPIIRKISTWTFLSVIVAMVALIVYMIATLPRKCNPPTFWYHGNLLYEVFPARFYSSRPGGGGDFRGIAEKAGYIEKLGARGVRLNSIFHNPNYPNDFDNVTSLTAIAPALGDLEDFEAMVRRFDSRNISVILDLPLYPYVKRLVHKKGYSKNDSTSGSTIEFLRSERSPELDVIEEAILHWISKGVKGFYLKGLEKLQDDPNLVESLRRWKRILGEDRILIVSQKFLQSTKPSNIDSVLNNVDLVDVKLDVTNGVSSISRQIRFLQNGTLFSKPGMPWIQWSLGNVYSERIANVLPHSNGTLGAILLQLMLPGTPSIFYGDEIGLGEDEGPRPMMAWPDDGSKLDEQIDLLSRTVELREVSPSIYMNSVYKEGVNKANMEIKYAGEQLLVMQRWYPRRKAYVLAANLGAKQNRIDLSAVLYGGEVVVGPRPDSKMAAIEFKDVALWPGESVIIVLK
ncbi:unnamed protein product [Phyllotreta striolata]|uniref:Glycosyl hydrolase family 13 catalytic domain-containing protein n=1 Tax=Phyllotreta striolata TaxID=444603 RepID=A0A9N9TU02_PHYSR|nr:unnamed protein product [Phyllotreta striolata]